MALTTPRLRRLDPLGRAFLTAAGAAALMLLPFVIPQVEPDRAG